jgi:hypothetical protein
VAFSPGQGFYNVVFHKKVYNKVMRFRGLLEEENNDCQCGKFEGGFK